MSEAGAVALARRREPPSSDVRLHAGFPSSTRSSMRNVLLAFTGALSMAAFGCTAPVEEAAVAGQGEAVEACEASAEASYYVVTHIDARKCAYPMCGGYFVKAVNREKTRCADGAMRAECHVVALDLGSIGLADADASKFEMVYGEGHGIVRGDLGQ